MDIFVTAIANSKKVWTFLEHHGNQRGGAGMIVSNKTRKEIIFCFYDPEDSQPFEKFLKAQSLAYQKFRQNNLPRKYAKLVF